MNYRVKQIARHIVSKIKFLNPLYGFASKVKTKRWSKMDDLAFFTKRYRENMGRNPDFQNPTTYNEKILWIQMHDHNPLYTLLSDKYRVKEWVSAKIGEEYVVPLLGVWDSVDDIPFSELPDECVLKCNHDCGSVYIKHKGVPFDIVRIKKTFGRALKRNYYNVGRVWGYKNIQPKVFCEEYIASMDGDFPRDYKIFCFNGEPRFAYVASDRGKNTKFDFFDLDWNSIPVKQHYPTSNYNIQKPEKWDEMLEISRKLSTGIPHVRVDLYIDLGGNILFGEMTFAHFSGSEPFEPFCYDEFFGNHLDLNKVDTYV